MWEKGVVSVTENVVNPSDYVAYARAKGDISAKLLRALSEDHIGKDNYSPV